MLTDSFSNGTTEESQTLTATLARNSQTLSYTRKTASVQMPTTSGKYQSRSLVSFSLLTLHTSSDFNFVRHEDKCVPVGPEPIPAGVCANGQGTYKGSSGWRKIPGNSCTGGNKDEKVDKDCSKAQPAEGEIIHQTVCPCQLCHALF